MLTGTVSRPILEVDKKIQTSMTFAAVYKMMRAEDAFKTIKINKYVYTIRKKIYIFYLHA